MLIVRQGKAPTAISRKGRCFFMTRRRNTGFGCGFTCAAFGAGLLAATICPTELLLVLAAVALVVLGCTRCKSR